MPDPPAPVPLPLAAAPASDDDPVPATGAAATGCRVGMRAGGATIGLGSAFFPAGAGCSAGGWLAASITGGGGGGGICLTSKVLMPSSTPRCGSSASPVRKAAPNSTWIAAAAAADLARSRGSDCKMVLRMPFTETRVPSKGLLRLERGGLNLRFALQVARQLSHSVEVRRGNENVAIIRRRRRA